LIFSDALTRLETAFHAELPGAAAHALLAPRMRRTWPTGFDPADVRQAAGLLLLFPRAQQAHVVLTLRADTLGRHRSQVSLPGGVVEPGETVERAALREAHEEIGLPPDDVRILGALTPLDIPVSGFRLHPVVGAVEHQPALRAADKEVARILHVSVDELADPSSVVEVRQAREGQTRLVPAFRVAGVEIWGATAMILAEFLLMLGCAID